MSEEKAKQVVLDTSKNVFAPAINSFVLQVVNDALDKGIKTLFFLARDAYLEYLLAKEYVDKYGLEIECKYLYVSRLSLRVPLYHLDIDQALSYITLGGIDVTPIKVMNRTGLNKEDGEKFVNIIADYLGIDENAQIPRDRLGDVKDLLYRDDVFIRQLQDNSYIRYEAAMDYLKQSGFSSTEKIGIVDSGWVGSIQKSLDDFRRQLGVDEPLEGYYYGLYELPAGVPEKHYHSFLFGPRSGLKKKVEFNNCLFEAIFSAPHGMTLEYRKESDGCAPVLADVSDKQIDFIKQIENVLMGYQKDLINAYSEFKGLCDLYNSKESKSAIEKNLFRFMSKPTVDEAETFGRMHFSDDVIDYDDDVMARRMSERALSENHLLNRIIIELKGRFTGRKIVVPISAWYEGSVMLYSKKSKVKRHLFGYKQYKYFMQYCKRKRWIRERKKDEKTEI